MIFQNELEPHRLPHYHFHFHCQDIKHCLGVLDDARRLKDTYLVNVNWQSLSHVIYNSKIDLFQPPLFNIYKQYINAITGLQQPLMLNDY